jgi:nitroreductase
MERPAPTALQLHDPILRRWSPRAFADRAVSKEQLNQLLEAARWAASSFNEQPWRFLIATKDDAEAYERLLGCLVPGNQVWARTAPVLMISLTSTIFAKNGKRNAHAWHDVGLAVGNLTIQAMTMGLFLHQMAGIDSARVRTDFALPENIEPVAGIALGYPGPASILPPELAAKEGSPRTRRALAELVFRNRFGEASPIVREEVHA